jgi:hypothetical protein
MLSRRSPSCRRCSSTPSFWLSTPGASTGLLSHSCPLGGHEVTRTLLAVNEASSSDRYAIQLRHSGPLSTTASVEVVGPEGQVVASAKMVAAEQLPLVRHRPSLH